MLSKAECRRLQIKTLDGEWQDADLAQLEAADVFRMYEPDGAPVVDAAGATEWTAGDRALVIVADLAKAARIREALQPFVGRVNSPEVRAEVAAVIKPLLNPPPPPPPPPQTPERWS